MKPFVACLLTYISLFISAAWAQSTPEISFETTTHDFGTIKEEVNEAVYAFNFTNTGTQPLTLTDVKASCGCTTPTWTKDPVPAGRKGVVSASYNTVGRPGVFEKAITVRARPAGANEDKVIILTIKGNVVPRPKTITDYYPQKIGNLRFSTNHVGFARLTMGSTATLTFKLFNEGTAPIKLQSITKPDYVAVVFTPGMTVAPNDSIKLPVTYDTKKKNDWGYLTDQMTLITDDVQEPTKQVWVSALIGEDFSKLTPEQKAQAAHISLKSTTYDFGTINAGDKVHHDFDFTNTGKQELIIRKTKASCGCTASQPDKTILKPGETSTIKVDYDSTGKNGKETKTVTVITNDPTQSELYLTIQGEVKGVAPAAGSAH